MNDTDTRRPPVAELIRFTTKADGQVIGSYFNGLFYSGTSNDCWSPQYVTDWCPVLAVPLARDQVVDAVAAKMANAANLPEWMRAAAWGQDVRPLAELVVDAILQERPTP